MGTAAAVIVGVALFVAGCLKLVRIKVWRSSAAGLGVPGPVAAVVPPLEIALGVLLIAQLWRGVVAGLAVGLLTGFTAVLVISLLRGQRPPCACFGSAAKRISWWDVARNVVLIALAAFAALTA